MPNVITSFIKRREEAVGNPVDSARHRRDGYFDDQDQWHDAEDDDDADRDLS
jgi:hypothetical protein